MKRSRKTEKTKPSSSPSSTLSPAKREFLKYINSLDWSSGTTKHEQTHNAALRGADLGLPVEWLRFQIAKRIADSGGELRLDTVDHQIRRAFKYVRGKCDSSPSTTPSKPTFSESKAQEVADACKVPDIRTALKKRSSVDPDTLSSSDVLSLLYRPGESVVILTEMRNLGYPWQHDHPRATPLPSRSERGTCFLINPVDGEFHPNPRNKDRKSRRCEECVTSWRYLLLESDSLPEETWLRIIAQLPLPIVSVTTSGNKSVHVLVRIDAASKEEWTKKKNEIRDVLVPLGADPQAMAGVKATRLAQSYRGNRKQELLYINPNADETPIIAKPERTAIVSPPTSNQP